MTMTKKQIDRALAQKTIEVIARVKELLRKNSMSQNDLAEKTDMQKQVISRLLSYPPGSNITLETLVKLELALRGDILESRGFYIDEFISKPDNTIELNRAIYESDLPEQMKKKFHDDLREICWMENLPSYIATFTDNWLPTQKEPTENKELIFG